MKFRQIAMVLLVMVLVLVACNQGNNSEEVHTNANDDSLQSEEINVQSELNEEQDLLSEDETVEDEPNVPAFTFMMNGLSTESEHLDRAVMVIVENQALARPQSGLLQADIIYEVLAEGDITRFAVMYQSEIPDLIGPVRSIRPYFIELGKNLDSYIIHAGWSPEAMKILTTGSYPFINQVYGGDHAYFWRSTDRSAPHNVYTSKEKILEGIADKQYRTEWDGVTLPFWDSLDDIQGDTAQKVTLDYIGSYDVTYEYDEEQQAYLRFMQGDAHVDRESNTQLAASNILIAEASHQIIDNVGRRKIDVQGPGHGWLVQAGKVREITWQMKDGLIRAYKDGEEQKLVPGQTWINIIPTGSGVHFDTIE